MDVALSKSELSGLGYVLLSNVCEPEVVELTGLVVKDVFDSIIFDEDEVFKIVYEIRTKEQDVSQVATYKEGEIADPVLEYKQSVNFKQLMLSFDFSNYLVDKVKYGSAENKQFHIQKELKRSFEAFENSIQLLNQIGILDELDTKSSGDDSYFGFLLNDSASFSKRFGQHYDLHKDDHINSVVVSLQLSPRPTVWKIGRDLESLEEVVQHQGDMVVMDAYDRKDRQSPWHLPLISDSYRNALVMVFSGNYRDSFIRWMGTAQK